MNYQEFKNVLNNFHISKSIKLLEYTSEIAGDAFPGEFNVSGFHTEIQNLENNPSSFWGIDRCLRIQDKPDDFHSNVFHMGIYATAQELHKDFKEPFEDQRFHEFQNDILLQFLELLSLFKIENEDLEITYYAGGNVGNTDGRDALLDKVYEFKEDAISKKFFTSNNIETFPVHSLANIDIHPINDALVGVRNEVAYKGVEIATIVFDFFKIKNTHLEPINYIGGYAIGVERLYALINNSTISKAIPRYANNLNQIYNDYPGTESVLLKDEALHLLFGQEVVENLENIQLSNGQSKLLRSYNKNLRRIESELK